MDYARELGIDLDALHTEAPMHPDQLRNHKRITKMGEAYWSHERFLVQAEYSSEAISAETPVKRTRVRRYEFTDAQLRIAERSLNAGGAV